MIDLSRPVTYLITKGEATPANYEAAKESILASVRDAVDAGSSMVQIREKRLTGKLLFDLIKAVREITRNFDTRLLVNDRVDIALAADADGVHLAANSLPVAVVRKYFPKDLIIGSSVHSVPEAIDAANEGADFCLLGPVFETPGKTAAGIDLLREVCEAVHPFPVLAVGGVDETNYRQVLNAGAIGLAAIRAFDDPEKRSKIMRVLQY